MYVSLTGNKLKYLTCLSRRLFIFRWYQTKYVATEKENKTTNSSFPVLRQLYYYTCTCMTLCFDISAGIRGLTWIFAAHAYGKVLFISRQASLWNGTAFPHIKFTEYIYITIINQALTLL